MEIKQRNFLKKTGFIFGDDSLKYICHTEGTTLSFATPYDEISFDHSDYQTRHISSRNFGILFMFIGAAHLSFNYMNSGKIGFSAWFAIGALCMAVYYITKTNYSIFETPNHRILIMKDSKHDQIYMEIVNRRKKLFLLKYGEINYDQNPTEEINKFIWLKEHKIISETEFKNITGKIKSYHENMTINAIDNSANGKTIN